MGGHNQDGPHAGACSRPRHDHRTAKGERQLPGNRVPQGTTPRVAMAGEWPPPAATALADGRPPLTDKRPVGRAIASEKMWP